MSEILRFENFENMTFPQPGNTKITVNHKIDKIVSFLFACILIVLSDMLWLAKVIILG